ncbi:MAG: Druantia anti-phage system protein DruA [Steroidobacteraceae bacterium]
MGSLPEPILLRYRGRDLTAQDVASIRATIATHYERGRTYIGVRLCEQWQWRQGNGEYKAFAARDLLRRLEQVGLVQLPAPQRVKINPPKRYEKIPLFLQTPLAGTLADHPAAVLREAQGADSYLWDYLLAQYHYLGRAPLVGEHLKQLIYIGEQVVGCLGWASAAWKILPRDEHIGWTLQQRRARLQLLANNCRFLLLPWVRLPHLASRVLAMSVRGLSQSWQRRYGHGLLLAETFVDRQRFAGTCYRAANWTRVGSTQGHGKRGHRYRHHGLIKDIYLYPLARHWRERLTEERSRA